MSPHPRAIWTPAADSLLVSHLTKEKDAGRQAESGWKKTSYEAAVALFAANNIGRTLQQVQDRWTRVRGYNRHLPV